MKDKEIVQELKTLLDKAKLEKLEVVLVVDIQKILGDPEGYEPYVCAYCDRPVRIRKKGDLY